MVDSEAVEQQFNAMAQRLAQVTAKTLVLQLF